MSPTKLLQINPSLFNVNSNTNKSIKHKPKSIMPQSSNIMNPNRKALLAKIKNFQKKIMKRKKIKQKLLINYQKSIQKILNQMKMSLKVNSINH